VEKYVSCNFREKYRGAWIKAKLVSKISLVLLILFGSYNEVANAGALQDWRNNELPESETESVEIVAGNCKHLYKVNSGGRRHIIGRKCFSEKLEIVGVTLEADKLVGVTLFDRLGTGLTVVGIENRYGSAVAYEESVIEGVPVTVHWFGNFLVSASVSDDRIIAETYLSPSAAAVEKYRIFD
jgi:hypothetical protein